MGKKLKSALLAMLLLSASSKTVNAASVEDLINYEDLLPNYENLIKTLESIEDSKKEISIRDMIFVNLPEVAIGNRYLNAYSIENIVVVGCYFTQNDKKIDDLYAYLVRKNEFESDMYLLKDSSYIGSVRRINANVVQLNSLIPGVRFEVPKSIAVASKKEIPLIYDFGVEPTYIRTFDELCKEYKIDKTEVVEDGNIFPHMPTPAPEIARSK